MYKISIDSGKDNFVSFEQGDIVKAQKFTGNDIRLTVLEVIKVDTDAFYGTLIDGVAPVAGMVFIRLDNTIDDDRKGAVVISATGSNTPFIDILFGQVTKSRYGRLDGITDALFPTIGGYGLYADNVYLKGELVLSSGENVQSEFDSQSVLIQANEDGILLKADQTSLDITDGIVSDNSAAIIVNAGEIVLRATQTDLDITDGLVSDNAAAIIVNAGNINLRVEKDDVINQINISTEGIVIAADNIEISGATTFAASYDPTDKLDLLDAGDLATLDVAEVTDLGTTVIVGGFLKTDLIDVNTLIAENIKTAVSGQRVEITSGTQTLNFYDTADDLIMTLDGPNKRIKILEGGSYTAFGPNVNVSIMDHNRVGSSEFNLNNDKILGDASNESFYKDNGTPYYKDDSATARKFLNLGLSGNFFVGADTWTFEDGLLTVITSP